MTTSLKRRAALCALLAGSALAPPALAQTAGSIPPPPVRRPIDDNGVDVVRGTFNIAQTDVTIGGPGRKGLHFSRSAINGSWSNSSVATIDKVNATVTVTIDNASDSFIDGGGIYTSTEGNGARLEFTGNHYVYTARDGTVARFISPGGISYSFYRASIGVAQDITYPDGTRIDFYYRYDDFCRGGYENGECMGAIETAARLQTIRHSDGYQLKFYYATNSTVLNVTQYASWARITSVRAINTAVEACDNVLDACSLSQAWPTASYGFSSDANGQVQTVTDPLNRVTTYRLNNDSSIRVRRPGATSDNIVVTRGTDGQVSSVTRDGVTFNYSYASGTENGIAVKLTTVTDPLSNTQLYVSDPSTFLIKRYRDEALQSTSYAHDAKGRVSQITRPEGDSTTISYDARGNVTGQQANAKPGSGLAAVSTSASFDATCSNAKTCNQPNSSTDAAGNVTNYTYDGTHGGVLTVTLPAATAGAVRPQTRFGYSVVGGAHRLTSTSACATSGSCAGTADEVRTTIAYGTASQNYLPSSTSSGAGNGSLTATTSFSWDRFGNQVTVDGPLAGTADTTRTIYDMGRQVVGVIGPDPDGSGVRLHRAVRLTYNTDGQVTLAERGATYGQADANWAAFQVFNSVWSQYDANGRKRTDELRAGGQSFQATQYTYDALGRPNCVIQRMNTSQLGALSATPGCTLNAQGSFGPDRISRTSYTARGEVAKVESGVGTTDHGDDFVYTYTNNGQVQTLKDGEGRLTTLEYDGLDRLAKTRFPSPSSVGSSSASDYEQLTYDVRSLVTSRRLRDGNSIGYSYDNLGRVSFKNTPNLTTWDEDITYGYDLLGRLTSVSGLAGQSFGYDALGRLLTESRPWYGTTSNEWDLAGKRTKMTWRGGQFVTFGYDMTGAMTEIRESGSTQLVSFSYDDLGRRVTLSRANGANTSYGYDAISRLTSQTDDPAGGTYDRTLTFGYNPAGQISSRTSSNDAYAYSGHANQDLAESSNGLNQLTQQGGTGLSYDGRGNVTAIGGSAYGYTSENVLATTPSSNYASDGLGNLVHSTGPSTDFYYNGGQLIEQAQAGPGPTQKRFVLGPGADEPLVEIDPAGAKNWLHADERGSVVAVTDGSGSVVGINRYDDYGQPQGTLIGRFGYTGQVWLPEIGMYHYKARTYAPGLGRFLQPDPIGYGDGPNLYGYVSGDPVNFADPLGLDRQNARDHTKAIGDPQTGSNTDRGCGSCAVQTIPGPQWQGGPSNALAREFIAKHGGMSGLAALVAARIAKGVGELSDSSEFRMDNQSLDSETFTVAAAVQIANSQKWVWVGGQSYLNPNYNSDLDRAFTRAVGAIVVAPIALIGAVEVGLPAASALGPRGAVFGSRRFGYGAQQGRANAGRLRFGFTPHQGKAFFRIGVGQRHIDIFSIPRPGM